jgi:ubiquinone/menaquinone biosynthesis C-methylase UbiE
MSAGDVKQFEWIAPLYDYVTPEVDGPTLEAALALADRPIERVLDVGGGTGRAARAVPATQRIVADPALEMLAKARDNDVEAVRADGATLPFEADCVDAVLVVDAFHHVADRRGVLRDAHRVLRPGGALVVVEFDPTTVRGRLLAAAEHLVGFDSTFQPPGYLRDDMERHGFDTTITDRGFTYTVAGITPST